MGGNVAHDLLRTSVSALYDSQQHILLVVQCCTSSLHNGDTGCDTFDQLVYSMVLLVWHHQRTKHHANNTQQRLLAMRAHFIAD